VFSEKTYLRVKIENLMYPFEDATYWLNLEFTLKYVFSENTPYLLINAKFLCKIIFGDLGTLSLGFSPVAKADMKWIKTINDFCPTVCQKNAENKYERKRNLLRCQPGLSQGPQRREKPSKCIMFVRPIFPYEVGYNIELT
jgi:hypothetical protein